MKWVKISIGISVLVLLIMWLMPTLFPVDDLDSVHDEFTALAVNMTIGRLLVIGLSGLLFWPFVTRLVMRYMSLDISRLQVRIMAWYLFIEAAILGSFWGAL